MSRISKRMLWAEMARRKVQFHPDTEWDKITLWGLFRWCDVSFYLKKGDLVSLSGKERGILWVRPTKETWENCVKPLVEKHTLQELKEMAGW